jgi:hypothetical protein
MVLDSSDIWLPSDPADSIYLRKLQKTTIFGVRISKNHHFSENFKRPPVLPLTVSRNTDNIF